MMIPIQFKGKRIINFITKIITQFFEQSSFTHDPESLIIIIEIA